MYQEHLAMESREKHQWKARYYEAENLIMTLDGKDEQKSHEVSMLKRELAKARKEIEETDELLMRDSKRARGPVTSMPDIAATSLSLSLKMILPLPMIEDFCCLLLFPVVVHVVLHFKVYPLA
jgi:hypothetical protein